MIYIYMNENLPFVATWMELEGITLSEINQRKKYCMILLICGLKKKNTVNITKKKQTHRCRRQSSGYQWKEGRREGQKRCRELRGANHYA